jgi:hypothetical protein
MGAIISRVESPTMLAGWLAGWLDWPAVGGEIIA